MIILHLGLPQPVSGMIASICRRYVKKAALLALAFCCFASGSAFAADYATVLMYHRFGEDKYPSTNIRLDQFEAHLDVLANGDYHIWPLDKIVFRGINLKR